MLILVHKARVFMIILVPAFLPLPVIVSTIQNSIEPFFSGITADVFMTNDIQIKSSASIVLSSSSSTEHASVWCHYWLLKWRCRCWPRVTWPAPALLHPELKLKVLASDRLGLFWEFTLQPSHARTNRALVLWWSKNPMMFCCIDCWLGYFIWFSCQLRWGNV